MRFFALELSFAQRLQLINNNLKIRKNFVRFSVILLSSYLLLHFLFFAFQKKIIFQPEKLQSDYKFNFEEEFEEFFISVENEKINALYFKTNKENNGTILYLHGNADNMNRWGEYASDFTSRGYDVLMIDYRGYGKSEGKPTEANIYKDAEAAYQWLLQKTDSQQIIIYGRSLGSGPATYLAAKYEAKLLILETPFESIECVDDNKLPLMSFLFRTRVNFPNDQYIQKVDFPIYIFHGTEDFVVPYDCAKGLEAFLKPEDRFITIEGGGHKNLNEFETYYEQLDLILSTNEPQK